MSIIERSWVKLTGAFKVRQVDLIRHQYWLWLICVRLTLRQCKCQLSKLVMNNRNKFWDLQATFLSMALTKWMQKILMSTNKNYTSKKCKHLNILGRTRIFEISSQASLLITQRSLKNHQWQILKISKIKTIREDKTIKIGKLGNKQEHNLKCPWEQN